MDTSFNIANFINNNKVKAPAPDVSNKPVELKCTINRPNVGVVDVGRISSTPLQDAIELKREENPHTIYKEFFKKYDKIGFNGILSLVIGACGIISLLSLFKKSR